MLKAFDFIGATERDYDPIIDAQFTGNMYITYDEGAQNKKALIGIPGSKAVLTFSELPALSEGRAAYVYRNIRYVVISDTFYSISSSNVRNVIGTLNTSSGFVSISANQSQLALCDGANYYIYDTITPSFSIINDDWLINPIMVSYLDGRFIIALGSSNKFYISDIEAGQTVQELQYAELTTSPDTLVGCAVLKRNIYIFGNTNTEVWYDAGSPDFPFARDNTINYDFGAAATGSIAVGEGYLMWLAQTDNGSSNIKICEGSEIKTASTVPINLQIQSFGDVSDARSFIYQINGHIFYVISFTKASATLLYDITMDQWTNCFMIDDTRYFAQAHMYYNSRHYMLAYNQPIMYEVSRNYVQNNGQIIKYVRTSDEFIDPDGRRICINSFEIDFKQGVPVSALQDIPYYTDEDGKVYTDENGNPYYTEDYVGEERYVENPVAYLSVSIDNGNTFGFQIPQLLGRVGQFRWRTIWRNFGVAQGFIFKLEVYVPMNIVIVGANIDYDILDY